MEFAFTEEQEMIRDTAAAFLAEVSDSEAVRRAMATEQGYDAHCGRVSAVRCTGRRFIFPRTTGVWGWGTLRWWP